MPDQNAFETRLADAFRRYANQVPTDVDAMALAREIASGSTEERRRQPRWWPFGSSKRTHERSGTMLIATGATAALSIALVGGSFVLLVNDRSQVVGGVYYEIEEDGQNGHLEKIVVAEPYRRKGVADALMNELAARLRAAGVRTLTTGFFRPEYFYGYGFRIEKKYAGLVKNLDGDDPGRPRT